MTRTNFYYLLCQTQTLIIYHAKPKTLIIYYAKTQHSLFIMLNFQTECNNMVQIRLTLMSQ